MTKRKRKYQDKLMFLVRILFFPLMALLYLLGWILTGIAWVIRDVLYQFYRFKNT